MDGAEPSGELEFEAKVLGPDGKILAARTFRSTAPAAGCRCRSGRCRIERVLQQGRAWLVPWAAEILNEAPPPATPPVDTEPDEILPERT